MLSTNQKGRDTEVNGDKQRTSLRALKQPENLITRQSEEKSGLSSLLYGFWKHS